jgi:hypothetical protein
MESDFIVPVYIDALAPDSEDPESAEHYIVGRLWGERWDVSESDECGFNPIEIGDISPTWMQVVETLLKSGQKFRSELGLDGYISDILFINEVLFHPLIEDRVPMIDAAIRALTGINSLVLMHYDQGEPHNLHDRELKDLGFKKIARSNLLLKDCSLRYPFGQKFPGGKQVELLSSQVQQQWLLEQWNKLVLDQA